jgi:GGDEF domain-containing protein
MHSLTPVPNFRLFISLVSTFISVIASYGSNFLFGCVDVDSFKILGCYNFLLNAF